MKSIFFVLVLVLVFVGVVVVEVEFGGEVEFLYNL